MAVAEIVSHHNTVELINDVHTAQRLAGALRYRNMPERADNLQAMANSVLSIASFSLRESHVAADARRKEAIDALKAEIAAVQKLNL